MFARMGEVSYVLATAANPGKDTTETLLESQRFYLRSIELCEGYLRGYYGLAVVSKKILDVGKLPSSDGKVTRAKVEKLNQRAVGELAGIVGRARRREKGWEGYDQGEVEAAGRLLEELQVGGGPK